MSTSEPLSPVADPVGAGDPETAELERRRRQRLEQRLRHHQSLIRLLNDRSDLHGVLPLADLVDESVRWTA